MLKPNLSTLLAVAAIGSTGSLVVAQQDAELDVNRTSEDRAVITIDRQQQQAQQQAQQQQGQQAANQQTVRGTIVSLETYLREGESAARNEQAQSAGTERPMALLSDDGELYIILDRPGQAGQRDVFGMADPQRDRLQGDQARQGQSRFGQTGQTTGQAAGDRQSGEMSPGYDIDADVDAQADADAGIGTTAQRDASGLDLADRDEIANEQAPAPGRERHTNRADMSATDPQRRAENLGEILADRDETPQADATARTGADVDADQQVYGMAAGEQRDKADKDKAHKSKLKVGEQVSLSGQVFERDNVKGIAVNNVNTQ